jgi:hypothetical protein
VVEFEVVEFTVVVVVVEFIVTVVFDAMKTSPRGEPNPKTTSSTHVPSKFARWIFFVQISVQYIFPASASSAIANGDEIPIDSRGARLSTLEPSIPALLMLLLPASAQ